MMKAEKFIRKKTLNRDKYASLMNVCESNRKKLILETVAKSKLEFESMLSQNSWKYSNDTKLNRRLR